MIRMHHVDEFEILERDFGLVLVDGTHLGGALRQGHAEFIDFFEAPHWRGQTAKTAHHAGQRPHQIKRRDHITGKRFHAEMGNRRQQKENQADEREKQKMAPVLRRDESHFSGDIVLLKGFGRVLHILVQKRPAAIAMQFQFLDAFGQRAEISEQSVLLLARQVQMMKRAANHQPINHRAQHDQHARADQYFPREPSQISRAAQQHREIHKHDRNRQQRLGDVENVVSQRHQQARRAEFLQAGATAR